MATKRCAVIGEANTTTGSAVSGARPRPAKKLTNQGKTFDNLRFSSIIGGNELMPTKVGDAERLK